MRVVWAGLFLTGLVLVGASVYETSTRVDETSTTDQVTTSAMEDGTPMPSPNGPKR